LFKESENVKLEVTQGHSYTD